MVNFAAPQPAPLPSTAPPVWPLVIADARERLAGDVLQLLLADMEVRDAAGRVKYGVPLAAGNGRDHLVDAYQEELDRAVYYRAEIEEGDPSGIAVRLYAQALDTLLLVRGALDQRRRAREAVRAGLVAQGWPDFTNHTPEAFGAIEVVNHLGLDSLAILELVTDVDTALDITIADADLRAVRTVGDLVRAGERALARRPS
jgi:hypothetical protein